MSLSPAPLVASRVALMPDGDVAEVVLDNVGAVYARWNNGSTWSTWWSLGNQAQDVSIGAANVSSTDTACVSVTFKSGTRGFYGLTASGVEGVSL